MNLGMSKVTKQPKDARKNDKEKRRHDKLNATIHAVAEELTGSISTSIQESLDVTEDFIRNKINDIQNARNQKLLQMTIFNQLEQLIAAKEMEFVDDPHASYYNQPNTFPSIPQGQPGVSNSQRHFYCQERFSHLNINEKPGGDQQNLNQNDVSWYPPEDQTQFCSEHPRNGHMGQLIQEGRLIESHVYFPQANDQQNLTQFRSNQFQASKDREVTVSTEEEHAFSEYLETPITVLREETQTSPRLSSKYLIIPDNHNLHNIHPSPQFSPSDDNWNTTFCSEKQLQPCAF